MDRTLTLDLPPGYRHADALAFHARDGAGVAEQTSAASSPAHPARIRKSVLLCGIPVLLDIALHPARADCSVHADSALPASAMAMAEGALANMLGLRINPLPLNALGADDALLAPLVRARPGLRIMQSASVFEALSWAIIGQQINLSFAIALRRTLIVQAGRQHGSGLWCYPEALDVAKLGLEALTSRKFSRAKADTVLRVARLIDNGELDLSLPPDQLAQELLAIKGIGPWTVNYTLLRGYGDPDCSLHGDVAIRLALQRLLGEAEKPAIARTQQILEQYRPHRSMAAAHLWASLRPAATD